MANATQQSTAGGKAATATAVGVTVVDAYVDAYGVRRCCGGLSGYRLELRLCLQLLLHLQLELQLQLQLQLEL
jgi:hypothetical protein